MKYLEIIPDFLSMYGQCMVYLHLRVHLRLGKKCLFKIIFWHKILIWGQIFFIIIIIIIIIFVALFKTFRIQNGDMVIFFLRLSEK